MTDRALVVTQQCPYPAMGGGALRVWQMINLLKHQGDVAVFTLFNGDFIAPANLDNVTWHHCNLHRVKRSLRDKFRRRLGQWQSSSHPRVEWLYTEQGGDQLRALANTFQPTVIIVAEIWLYRYLPVLERQSCPIILDNHNIEGDDSRYRNEHGHLTIDAQTLKTIRYVESDFVKRVNQTWLCSQTDREQFLKVYRNFGSHAQQLHIVANGLDADYYQQTVKQPEPWYQYSILFLGRFSYDPNAEAAEILINQVYPLLKASTPQCQLYLVGCDPTATMLHAAQTDPNIKVTGRVDDVRPYLSHASVMVVPLYRGSGTRLKLLEGFAAKCPIVSTVKGAEGLAVVDNQQLLIRESAAEMAAAVETLWHNPKKAQTLVEEAHQTFLDHYAWYAVNRQLQQALAALP